MHAIAIFYGTLFNIVCLKQRRGEFAVVEFISVDIVVELNSFLVQKLSLKTQN